MSVLITARCMYIIDIGNFLNETIVNKITTLLFFVTKYKDMKNANIYVYIQHNLIANTRHDTIA
jgi:hypothetical protein